MAIRYNVTLSVVADATGINDRQVDRMPDAGCGLPLPELPRIRDNSRTQASMVLCPRLILNDAPVLRPQWPYDLTSSSEVPIEPPRVFDWPPLLTSELALMLGIA
ncbi:hypothetical protein B296_00000614 [Ensete ventricosum]|uniref:Uncharacterized protein n=1 Tax=Ensete ventricosum TaxID=4639 RepID=A0A427A8Y8_ENSVE|nr:hypothetical protein B296_00000614 [Ensete ventricosum]